MTIEIKRVSSRKELQIFIHLPARIHMNHKNWVPPIYMDDWTFFNPKKNRAFDHCDTVLALALKEGKPVGRIMGIISHPYNHLHHENHGRFAFLETWNDQEVFDALVDFVANWAKEKGMVKLVGPLAFSDKDPQGFLIDGFDEPVSIASNCNFPYMVELTEKSGFQKKFDLVVYKIPIPDEMPGFYTKIAERFYQNNGHLSVVEFTSRRKIRPYIRPVFELVNRSFTDIYGFSPFTLDEMDDFANRFLFLINPKFVKLMVNEKDEVVSFVIGMSDISRGIQKSRGRLFPFGFTHIFRAGKKSQQLNLLLGAVDPAYQGRGLDVIMGIRLLESAKLEGKTTIDTHLELEYNTKVRGEMEKMGGEVYKRFRIFQKDLL
jgi:GNAT superfamily N-acetyltransferase